MKLVYSSWINSKQNFSNIDFLTTLLLAQDLFTLGISSKLLFEPSIICFGYANWITGFS